MLKIIRSQWDKNRDKLKAAIQEINNVGDLEYFDLVKLTFDVLYNNNLEDYDDYALSKVDIERITKIDNGDYQGTYLYVIPYDTYQPSEQEYFITFVDYGSCSGCDTLQAIVDWDDTYPTERQTTDLLKLCEDIFTHTVKPFNNGWRHNELFDEYEEAV